MTTVKIIRTLLTDLPTSEKLVALMTLTAFPALLFIFAAMTP